MPTPSEEAVAKVLARLRGFPSLAFVSEEGQQELIAWARECLMAAERAVSNPQEETL